MRCGTLDASFPLSFQDNKRAPRAALLARFPLLLLFPTALAGCLPNAVLPENRQNLTNTLGESYPIGLVLSTWRSAYLATAVIEILGSEVMGYNTRRLEPSLISLEIIFASLSACFQLLLPPK